MTVATKGFADSTRRSVNAPDSRFLLVEGGPSGGEQWSSRSLLRIPMSAAAAAAGSLFSKANPFGRTVIIGQAYLDRTAGTTGTLEIGVAANGTTSSSTIFTMLAATATLFNSVTDKGVSGLNSQRWGATQFITGTPSVTPTGIVGYLYIEIIDP